MNGEHLTPAVAGRPFRLIVTGGGTGGHTYPALTAVRTLQARLAAQGTGLEVLWVGKADSLESRVAAAESIAFTSVATGKIRRSRNPIRLVSPSNVADMSRVPIGVLQARKAINGFGPDVVLRPVGTLRSRSGWRQRASAVFRWSCMSRPCG